MNTAEIKRLREEIFIKLNKIENEHYKIKKDYFLYQIFKFIFINPFIFLIVLHLKYLVRHLNDEEFLNFYLEIKEIKI